MDQRAVVDCNVPSLHSELIRCGKTRSGLLQPLQRPKHPTEPHITGPDGPKDVPVVDMLEPWVLKATLVVGTLAAINIWLFMLSTKLPTHASAADRQPERREQPADS
jgi:hypothetical protein